MIFFTNRKIELLSKQMNEYVNDIINGIKGVTYLRSAIANYCTYNTLMRDRIDFKTHIRIDEGKGDEVYPYQQQSIT